MVEQYSTTVGLTDSTHSRPAYKCTSSYIDNMKLNISNPATGAQKLYDFEEEKNL